MPLRGFEHLRLSLDTARIYNKICVTGLISIVNNKKNHLCPLLFVIVVPFRKILNIFIRKSNLPYS